MTRRAVVVPGALALLPAYAGLGDPLPQARAAALEAVRWLVETAPPRVVVLVAGPDPANVARGVADPSSLRVARHLLELAGHTGAVEPAAQPGPLPDLGDAPLLVVADGSARRGERAPGHLDDRAAHFDKVVTVALGSGDARALASLDEALGAELLAAGVPALRALGQLAGEVREVRVDHDDDPFGVQYWVVRWTCEL